MGGAGGGFGGRFALDDVAEPAEQITSLNQCANKYQRDQHEAIRVGKQVHQFPLGVETGEGWQAAEHGDEGDEGEDEQRAFAQGGPGGQFAFRDQAREPVEPGLGYGVGKQQAEGNEGCRLAEDVALAEHQQHQPGLRNRGIAELPPVVGLRQGQQVAGRRR